MADAKMDGASVLAITGLQRSDLIGTLTQQDVALDKLFIDLSVYNERVTSGAHMESVTDLAIRSALSRRSVAHITIPVDVQVQEVQKGRSARNPAHRTTSIPAYPEHLPAHVEMVFLGNLEFGYDLHPCDFVTIARGCGIDAAHIDDASQRESQLDSITNSLGPRAWWRLWLTSFRPYARQNQNSASDQTG